MHQVIVNMLVTKYLANKFFDYIYPRGETLATIAWVIRDSSHSTIKSTSGQDVFVRDMIFNLTSVVYWRVITAGKQRQVDIDDV